MKTSNLIRTKLWLLLTAILSVAAPTNLKAQSTKSFIYEEDKLEWIMNGTISDSPYELKHVYSYDSKKRIKERQTFYWEKRTQKGLPYYQAKITYRDDTTLIETAYWNWKNNKFELDKQLIDHRVDKNKETVEYKIFVWDAINKEWKTEIHQLIKYHYADNLK